MEYGEWHGVNLEQASHKIRRGTTGDGTTMRKRDKWAQGVAPWLTRDIEGYRESSAWTPLAVGA